MNYYWLPISYLTPTKFQLDLLTEPICFIEVDITDSSFDNTQYFIKIISPSNSVSRLSTENCEFKNPGFILSSIISRSLQLKI